MASPLDQAWRLLSMGQPLRAVAACNAILAKWPDQPGALTCRGMARWSAGQQSEQALADLQRARDLAPEQAGIRHNLATVLASLGDFAAAEAEFRAALDLNPQDGAALLGLVQNARPDANDPAVMAMIAAFAEDRLAPAAREQAGFGLAQLFDRLGDHERAFSYARQANELVERAYDPVVETRRWTVLENLVRRGALAAMPRSDYRGPAPVFIGGMPRSGTTLVEAILAAHPDLFGAGESGVIGWIEHEMGRALRASGFDGTPDEMVLKMSSGDLGNGARAAVSKIAAMADGRLERFVDKTPANSLSVGLIAALFPDAKFIQVRRHPLDVGVSNFFTRFQSGQGFSFSLEGIGAHSRIVAETAALWAEARPIDMLEVSYEALVADPAPQIRRMLAFCGVPDDPVCHGAVGAGRTILTASQHQVRQPISARSVGRWRAYEAHLGPMIAAMGGQAWIDAQAAVPSADTTE